MKLLLLALSLAVLDAQIIEWVPIVFDPPGSTPTQLLRMVTVQAGKPTIVAPYVPSTSATGHFESVFATQMRTPTNEIAWCLHPTAVASLSSLAVEISGLLYSFNPAQKEIGKPFSMANCASAIIITALTPLATPLRVGALLWVWQ